MKYYPGKFFWKIIIISSLNVLTGCNKNSDGIAFNENVTLTDSIPYGRLNLNNEQFSAGDYLKLTFDYPATKFINEQFEIIDNHILHPYDTYNVFPAIYFLYGNKVQHNGVLTLYGPDDADLNPNLYKIQQITIIENNLFKSAFNPSNWTQITNYTFTAKNSSISGYNEYSFDITSLEYAYIIVVEI